MPLKVSVSQSGAVGSRLTADRVQLALREACMRSVQALGKLIRQELLKRISMAEITDEAKVRIPALANLEVLLSNYSSCFRVEETDDGARLILDRKKLQEFGLPAQLPELLEYGSRVGIAPMAHMRTAPVRFRREVVAGIAKSIVRDLD